MVLLWQYCFQWKEQENAVSIVDASIHFNYSHPYYIVQILSNRITMQYPEAGILFHILSDLIPLVFQNTAIIS